MTYTVVIVLTIVLGFILFKNKIDSIPEVMNYADIDVKEAKKMLSKGEATALDVRTSLEVSHGKIIGSKSINFSSPSFADALNSIEKNETYIVYCRSGRRSRQACKAMSKQGFKNIYNLAGGYNVWS
ncbi:MAG: rhodanese-related sulfurtransferase [Saprospiraceae bacterium]|jgi:rhodanese-related sulfurtransferase